HEGRVGGDLVHLRGQRWVRRGGCMHRCHVIHVTVNRRPDEWIVEVRTGRRRGGWGCRRGRCGRGGGGGRGRGWGGGGRRGGGRWRRCRRWRRWWRRSRRRRGRRRRAGRAA